MACISSVGYSAHVTSCYIPIITPAIDVIATIASKIFALLEQLFSRVREGFSWVSSRLSCEPANNPLSFNERTLEDVQNFTSLHSEASRGDLLQQILQMYTQQNELIFSSVPVFQQELNAMLTQQGSPSTECLRAIKDAARQGYTRILPIKQAAEQSFVRLRSEFRASLPATGFGVLVEEDVQRRFIFAIVKLRLETAEAIRELNRVTLPLQEIFITEKEEIAASHRYSLEIDSATTRVGLPHLLNNDLTPEEAAYEAIRDLFILYYAGFERCIKACDQAIHFNEQYQVKYAKIQELETDFESPSSPETVVELNKQKETLFWASSKIKEEIAQAQVALEKVYSTVKRAPIIASQPERLFPVLNSEEALREVEKVDDLILSIEEIHIALLEGAQKNFTACKMLGLASAFNRDPKEHTKLSRFDLDNVKKFLGALEETLKVCVLDRDKCTEEFSRRIRELEAVD